MFYGLINEKLINMGSALKFKVELGADCPINESSDEDDFRKCK